MHVGTNRPDGSSTWKDENSRLIARRVLLLNLSPATGNNSWALLEINILGGPVEMGLVDKEP